VVKLTRSMTNTIVHYEGAALLEVAVNKIKLSRSIIKIGLDVHARLYVAVAQYDHLLPKPARRLAPMEFLPWVEQLLRAGHTVHVVYEACGFGFDLYRELKALGAHCYVIAPRKLDEQFTRVKTDPRDAATLCQRLSRYLDGNTRELAVIRVPTEREEQARHVSRQREQLVRLRQKLEAQGRSLLISHSLPSPAHWWKNQTWSRLRKLLPAWICIRLEVHRPALLTLQKEIDALSAQLEAAAPADVPLGIGKLSTVVMTREICSWERFSNRRAISCYTGLCPGEYTSGTKRVPGSVTKHGNPRLRAALVECAWRMVRFQPNYPPVKKRLAILAKGARATGAQRKKAIVAVARHLAVDLWRIHTGRCSAAQLKLNNAEIFDCSRGTEKEVPAAPAMIT
jgi:transposase